MPEPRTMITLRIDGDVLRRVDEAAHDAGLRRSELIRSAIARELAAMEQTGGRARRDDE